MKQSLLVLVAILMTSSVMAQKTAQVVKSNLHQLTIEFTTTNLNMATTSFDNQDFVVFDMPGFVGSTVVGAPMLPVNSNIVEIPICEEINYTIENAKYDTLDLGLQHLIMPAQPSVCKSDYSHHDLQMSEKVYEKNEYFSHPLIRIKQLGIARDKNLATIFFSPIQYNPQTGKIVVCTHATISFNYENVDEKATYDLKRYSTPAFTIGQEILNTLNIAQKNDNAVIPVRLLVVSHPMFEDALSEYVSWKRRKGFDVDVVYMGQPEVGNSSVSLINYIKSLYTNATTENPAPTYVVLVGDVDKVPACADKYPADAFWYEEHHPTDLYYAAWTDDMIPDAYYGRFSAQTVEQLIPQLEKTLMYEQYTFADPSFLDNAVLVAGQDDNFGRTHADPTVSQASKFYINGDNGYAQVKCFQNNMSTNPGGTNVSVYVNTNKSTVGAAYNEGAGWINYTAHGNIGEWSLPAFRLNDVHAMSNVQKFGVMIGNCCLSNKFNEPECFGEALLRQSNYTGAVNYIGGSNYTYWTEDVYWSMGIRPNIYATMPLVYDANNLGMYDQLFHLNGESRDKWINCVGGIILSGNMSVEKSGSSLSEYYWEVYHVLGDPSVVPLLTQANDMPLFPLTVITAESNSVDVITAPYAYVALTHDSVVIAAVYANETGQATLHFNNLDPDQYELVSSAMGYKTKFFPMYVYSLGINNATDMNVRIYPNPAVFNLVVEAEGVQEVSIMDVTGREVMCEKGNSDKVEIDIQTLSNGVYFVKVKAMDRIAVRKIVKK